MPLPYRYKPLGLSDIRIIALQPAVSQAEHLRCRLIPTSYRIDQNHSCVLPYEAVSYAWGDSSRTDFIEVEEPCGDPAWTGITSSVDSLLRSVRQSDGVRYLWVDFLCIDQKSNVEKAEQVRKMGDIYDRADRVIVWLGTSSWDTAEIFETLRSFNEDAKNGLDDTKYDFRAAVDRRISSMSEFLRRPWFKRRWVIQEVVKGHPVTLLCGPHQIDFDEFVEAVGAIFKYMTFFITINEDSINTIRTMRLVAQKHPLRDFNQGAVHLLSHFHASLCSDPRDIIYSLLSIIVLDESPADTRLTLQRYPSIKIDYATPLLNLWRNFGLDHVTRRRTNGELFELLQCAGAFRDVSKCARSLPSFLPNWSMSRRFCPLLGHSSGSIIPQSSVGTAAMHVLSLDSEKLVMQGVIVDSTIACGAGYGHGDQRLFEIYVRESGLSERECFLALLKTFNSNVECLSLSKTLMVEESRLRITAWDLDSIRFGTERQDLPQAFMQVLGALKARDWAVPLHVQNWIKDQTTGYDGDGALAGFNNYITTMKGRVLIVSENQRLGMAPEDIKPGDLVAVFTGSPVPFIIRPITDDPSLFCLIGDAYIPGIMPGDKPDLSQFENRTIELV